MVRGINIDRAGFVTLDGNRVTGEFKDESGARYFAPLGTDADGQPLDNYANNIGATHLIECHGDLNWPCRYAKVLETVVHVATDENDDGVVWESWVIRGKRSFI